MKDQALDGVDAEVLYPSVLFSIYQLQDAEIMQATMANYNDWVLNYASQAPGRLFALALVQLYDLDAAIAEMRAHGKRRAPSASRCPAWRRPTSRSAIPTTTRSGLRREDMRLPLTMHIFTGHVPNHGLPREWGQHGYTVAHAGMIRTIQDLVWSGVCERFPGLRFVPTEFDTGWIAHFLYRDDYNFGRMGGFRTHPQLKMKPSGYFHQNFCVTFEDDEVGIRTRDLIGVENLLWGSDYPHADSLFPESQPVLDRIFTGVPRRSATRSPPSTPASSTTSRSSTPRLSCPAACAPRNSHAPWPSPRRATRAPGLRCAPRLPVTPRG